MNTTVQSGAGADVAFPGGSGAVALWNPTAAALWSLALSPAFGAWIHMRNWERLGEEEKAKEAGSWCVAVCALHLINLAIVSVGAALGHAIVIPHSVGLAFFAAWYIRSGHAQIRHVAESHVAGYARRPWRGPLLVGSAAMGALIVLTLLLPAAVALGSFS